MQVRATHQIGGAHLTAVTGPVPLIIGLYPVTVGGSDEPTPAIVIRGVPDGPPGVNPPHSQTATVLRRMRNACADLDVTRYTGEDGHSLVLTGDIRAAWKKIGPRFNGQAYGFSVSIDQLLPRYERRMAGQVETLAYPRFHPPHPVVVCTEHLDVGQAPWELAMAMVLDVSQPLHKRPERRPVEQSPRQRRAIYAEQAAAAP